MRKSIEESPTVPSAEAKRFSDEGMLRIIGRVGTASLILHTLRKWGITLLTQVRIKPRHHTSSHRESQAPTLDFGVLGDESDVRQASPVFGRSHAPAPRSDVFRRKFADALSLFRKWRYNI